MKNLLASLSAFYQKRPQKIIINSILGFCLFCFIFLLGFYLAVRASVFTPIPDQEDLKAIKTAAASEVYSSDGVLLGRYYIENRTHVDYDKISPNLVDALVATEDARFYDHGGIDFQSMIRVLIKSLLMGDDSSGGGSTISQQLAKNLYPRESFKYLSIAVNKMKEMIIAQKLEDIYDKNQILNLYLNTVPFSDNTYGVQVASKRFFNKDATDLHVQEAATLIGMLKATSTYNPRTNLNTSTTRRNTVLLQMQKFGSFTETEKDSLQSLPLELDYTTDNSNDGMATYFREHIRKELKDWAANNKKPNGKPYNIYTDGLKIHTTIDSRMQAYAEEAVQEHMQKLQSDFDDHWKGDKPYGDEQKLWTMMRTSDYYKRLKKNGLSESKIKAAFQKPKKIKVFTYEGEKEIEMSSLDSIKYYYTLLNTGFLVSEPQTGQVKAWVGGTQYRYFKYDHVMSSRQVGSTFKPIVYAAALEKGISPCSYVANKKTYYPKYKWQPKNSDDKYGGYYSLSGGLRNSMNTITIGLMMHVGTDRVQDLAKRMGITSEIPSYPSIALGVADISLFDMVKMYGTFANRGKRMETVMITKIENNKGKLLANFTDSAPKGSVVLEEDKADMMIKMLQTVVDSGTARRLRFRYKFTHDIAGKTGTTQNQSDGWFMGFTPDLVGGVWVGGQDPSVHFKSIRLGQGANMALPIWGIFMDKVLKDDEFAHFKDSKFIEADTSVNELLTCRSFSSTKPPNTLTQRLILINEEPPETEPTPTYEIEEIEEIQATHEIQEIEEMEEVLTIEESEIITPKAKRKKKKNRPSADDIARDKKILEEARKKAEERKKEEIEKVQRKEEKKKRRRKKWDKFLGRENGESSSEDGKK